MRPASLLYRVLILYLLSIPFPLIAQHKAWIQYTDKEGLPSNIIYEVMQDSHGHLWFATSQGICRFNGYEFHQPEDTSSYRGREAFVPVEDSHGTIWFGRLDGTLWFIKDDTIRAWQYNAIPLSYQGQHTALDQLGIAADGTVWIAFIRLGLVRVKPDGSYDMMCMSDRTNFTFTVINHKTIYTIQTANVKPLSDKKIEVIEIIAETGEIRFNTTLPFDVTNSFHPGIWELKEGEFVFYQGQSLYHIKDGQMVNTCMHNILAETMALTRDGGLLFASHSAINPGLYQYNSVKQMTEGMSTRHLSDQFVNYILCDREGGWWVATADKGVFYCKNPGLDIYDSQSGMISDEILSVTSNGKNTVYAGTRPAAVYAIANNGPPVMLPDPGTYEREINDLEYDSHHQRLWISDPLQSFDSLSGWSDHLWRNTQIGIHNILAAKKITPAYEGDFLYISAASGFGEVNNRNREFSTRGYSDNQDTRVRTFSVTPDHSNTLWVTTADGLKIWRNDRYVPLPFEHEALQYQPRDVVFLDDSTMIIALNKGILIRETGGTFTHLTESDGLTSDITTRLELSDEGKVFVCTSDGLNQLTKTVDGWQIQSWTEYHGFPSNQVYNVTTLNNQIWMATSQGLVRMTPVEDTHHMSRPILEYVSVNNTKRDHRYPLSLRHQENNIAISYYAMLFRAQGDILYRYRLNAEDSSYTLTKNREVHFAQLNPGSYQFAVQAQNTNGTWSDPATFPFEISPAWWQTWWFRSGIFLLAFSGLWLYYRRRLQNAKRELEIQNKIRDLEAAALRAQMNPHFIFNCLVSIQQFISENDKDSATAYLARFARLVRLALHSSVDGKHSLHEEVEMLENYLALEQLRFKNRFTYVITVSPEIDTNEIFIPPLLIQPFVENAIVHGMKNKRGDGRIEIAFSKTENLLAVTVTDNGPGIFDAQQPKTDTGHKSVGMTLTQRRLDILSGQANDGRVSHENITDVHGVMTGHKVSIEVPLE